MGFSEYVFSLLKHENIFSGVAVDTGSLQNICNNVYLLGKMSLSHTLIASCPVFDPVFPMRESLVFHSMCSNSLNIIKSQHRILLTPQILEILQIRNYLNFFKINIENLN